MRIGGRANCLFAASDTFNNHGIVTLWKQRYSDSRSVNREIPKAIAEIWWCVDRFQWKLNRFVSEVSSDGLNLIYFLWPL